LILLNNYSSSFIQKHLAPKLIQDSFDLVGKEKTAFILDSLNLTSTDGCFRKQSCLIAHNAKNLVCVLSNPGKHPMAHVAVRICECCGIRFTTHEVSADFYEEAQQNLILVSKLYKLLGTNQSVALPTENKCTDCSHNRDGGCAFDFPEYDTPDSFDCNHYDN